MFPFCVFTPQRGRLNLSSELKKAMCIIYLYKYDVILGVETVSRPLRARKGPSLFLILESEIDCTKCPNERMITDVTNQLPFPTSNNSFFCLDSPIAK